MAPPGKLRVLITGISGFTGRHLANVLVADGWEIFGIGPERLDAEADHLDVDLSETRVMSDWIARIQPTHVVHLAALAHVVGDPLSFYRVNVLGTESLLEALSQADAKLAKVLIASSANIYGNALHSPISESAPIRPMNHYALSKAAMELLCAKWFERTPIVLSRPFNYTGPGQSVAFVFPKIVAAYRRRDPVLRLGNLDVARDLSDVRFVCEAYRRLLLSNVHSDVVNICSGKSVALMTVLNLMEQISGFRPRVEIDAAFVRKDEVQNLCGDPSRLFERVGVIETTPLRSLLQQMYESLPRSSEGDNELSGV